MNSALLTQWAWMGIAVAGWAFVICVLVGVGAGVATSLRLRVDGRERFVTLALLGLCGWMVLAGLVHFVMPLNRTVVLLLAAPFSVGGGWWLWRQFRNGGDRLGGGPLVVLILFTVWLANRATSVADGFDALAYHLPQLKWTITYPLVPGLANLHYRLGFPSLFYGYAALVEFWPARGIASAFCNAPLLWLAGFRAILGAGRLLKGGGGSVDRPSDLFHLATLPFVVWLAAGETANNIATDVGSYVLALFSAARLLRTATDPAERVHDNAIALLLATGSLAIKLSNLGWVVGVAIVVVLRWSRARREPGGYAPYVGATVACVTLVAILGARGYVVSGYPLFPAPWSAVGLRPVHQVPVRMARFVETETRQFSRHESPQLLVKSLKKVRVPAAQRVAAALYREKLEGWNWVVPYAVTFPIMAVVTHVLPACIVVACFLRRGTRGETTFRDVWIAVAAALLFWALTAPDMRFSAHFLWIAVGLAVVRLAATAHAGRPLSTKALASLAVLAGVVMVGHSIVWTGLSPTARLHMWGHVWEPPRRGGVPPLPRATTAFEFVTNSGVKLSVPKGFFVGWGPLLSTQYPERTLRLLDPASEGGGLGVDPATVTVPPGKASAD